VAEAWRTAGFEVELGWSHDSPDVVLHSNPPVTISVKSFNLVPSSMRYGSDGRHSFASARTIYRKDVEAEIGYYWSVGWGILLLTVINQRNGTAEHIELNPLDFKYYTTSQALNNDNGEKDLVVLNVKNPHYVAESEELGWWRITNRSTD
jgi:hypothetical protein